MNADYAELITKAEDGSADGTIVIMEAVSYTATNEETGGEDKEQLRCSKSFMGLPGKTV